MLHHAPREEHRGQLGLRRLALGHDLPLEIEIGLGVAALHEHAARDGTDEQLLLVVGSRQRSRQLFHQPQVLFLLQQSTRVGLELGRDDHFAENLADRLRERQRECAIGDDDAAEGRLLVGRERLVPRLAQVGIAADAARICVLENRDRRLGKFVDQLGGGRDVEDVVVRKFLAVELLKLLVEAAVQRRRLVRIFADVASCSLLR